MLPDLACDGCKETFKRGLPFHVTRHDSMQAQTNSPYSVSTELKFHSDLLALFAFLVGAFATIWHSETWEAKILFALSLAALTFNAWLSRGKTVKPEHRSAANEWARMALLTLFAGVAIVVVCRFLGLFHGHKILGMLDKTWGHWLSVKLPTVVGQQIMLQLLLVPVLLRLFKNTKAAVFCGAVIFALLHLPNPLLVGLTFVAGLVWTACYCQGRQLIPIVASHFILAVLVAGCCGEFVFNMRIGPDCLSLFPKKIMTEDEELLWEFPGCVIGCAEKLIQQGDDLIVEGWALDSIHNQSPQALFMMIDDRIAKITDVEFERVASEQFPAAVRSGFVGSDCYSFVARIPRAEILSPDGISLYAANSSGRLARIGQMGEIIPMQTVATDRPIVLFPVEVDGRVNHVLYRDGNLRLKGWTADIRNHELPNQICFEFRGRLKTIELDSHRAQRRDIAIQLDEPVFENSGFDLPLGQVSIFDVEKLRCYAIDKEQQLHPIQLTEQAQTRVARIMDSGNGRIIR